jgi:hypothetical protein
MPTRDEGRKNASIKVVQRALRRPLRRLKTRTTRATTSRRCIRPPAMWKLKPRSHKIRTTTKTVQSMLTFLDAAGAPAFAWRGARDFFTLPCYFDATACALALPTASRKECADAGIATSPLSMRAFETLWP